MRFAASCLAFVPFFAVAACGSLDSDLVYAVGAQSVVAEIYSIADRAVRIAVRVARRETWGIAAGPFVGIAKRKTDSNDVTERSLGVEPSGDRFFALSAVILFRAGVDVRAAWIAQTVRRNDAEHAVLAGFASETHHDAGALAGGAHLGFRLVVAAPFYLDVGLRAMALGTRTATGVDVRALGGGTLGVGLSL